MKIVLFGGAFDPPHLGHERIAQELIDKKVADQVWFVPVGSHAFSKNLSSAEDRLAMLNLILTPQTRIETFEIDHQGVSYTLDTLKAMSDRYPEHEFSWVIGSDNLEQFHLWDDGKGNSFEIMLASFKFFVYPRSNYPFKPIYKNMFPLSEMSSVDVSSTLVRQKAATGESLIGLVSPAVESYISQHHLYR